MSRRTTVLIGLPTERVMRLTLVGVTLSNTVLNLIRERSEVDDDRRRVRWRGSMFIDICTLTHVTNDQHSYPPINCVGHSQHDVRFYTHDCRWHKSFWTYQGILLCILKFLRDTDVACESEWWLQCTRGGTSHDITDRREMSSHSRTSRRIRSLNTMETIYRIVESTLALEVDAMKEG